MSKKVLLVGHCGPDSSYLRMVVRQAAPMAQVVGVDDAESLKKAMAQPVDLLLMNRVLDYGFETTSGIDLIRDLHKAYPALKMMMVSNYPDAQSAARAAGAIGGFGKREIGSAMVLNQIKAAMNDLTSPEASSTNAATRSEAV